MKRRDIVLVACLAGTLCGCARQVDVHNLVSPDGKITLRIEIDDTGGAAVAEVTSAYVYLSDEGSSRKKLVFKGTAVSSFNAVWRSPKVVMLSYSDGYVSVCNAMTAVSSQIKVTVSGCSPGSSPSGTG